MGDIKKSAEVVDKLINHVCYKKTEGKLYLMTERLGWMTNTSEQFKISESYRNIRMQRVSVDDKEKVQLQLLIHSGSSYTFHFLHPEGKEAQLRDRNEVKNYLQLILPKFKDKATSELEHKKKLCERNPQVLELYRELVAGKYICKEEFWERTETVCDLASSKDVGGYPCGVPSCIMTAEPEPLDHVESINLSHQMIEDIFQVYPSIKRKYNQIVKDKKDEKDFWARLFQSHYFHRTRSNLSLDIFAQCADQDISELSAAAKELESNCAYTSIDRPSDMKAFEDNDEPQTTDKIKQSASNIHLELLKRFNRHTFMLLRAMDRDSKGTKRPSQDVDLDNDASKSKRIAHETVDIYIEAEKNTDVANVGISQGVPFNTDKITEYIYQRSEVSCGADKKRITSNDMEQRKRLINLKKSLGSTTNNRPLTTLISSSIATEVLTTIGHLNSNADGVINGQQVRSLSTIPNDMERDVKVLYRVSAELMRHFWGCFPVIDAAGFERLHRIKDAIKRFKEQRLEQFAGQHTTFYVLTGSSEIKPTEHLTSMFDNTLEAFNRYLNNYNHISKSKELQ